VCIKMVKYIRRGLVAVAAVLLVALPSLQSVGAQSNSSSGGVANGFRVSPVRSEVTVDKGKNTTVTITVENPTNVATVAQPVVNDFIASDDESGTPRLILDSNVSAPKNSFKKLVGDLPKIPLGSREKKDINVKVAIPSSASAGGYYGAIRFVPSGTEQNGNVGLTASVGTIVLVTVPGDLKERLDLAQLSASQDGKTKGFITSGDVSVLTRLNNTGDIHVRPFGRVNVKNMFGSTVASYELNDKEPRSNILPGSTRKFEDKLPKDIKWFGRYTIQTNLGYSQGGGELIIANATFWYMPTWTIYATLILMLAIAGGGYFLYRKLSKKSHRKV
jgi:hypothetical protein